MPCLKMPVLEYVLQGGSRVVGHKQLRFCHFMDYFPSIQLSLTEFLLPAAFTQPVAQTFEQNREDDGTPYSQVLAFLPPLPMINALSAAPIIGAAAAGETR